MPELKITDEDRTKIDPKFICIVCNLLLCKPMQTHCGHLMCFSCLDTLLKSSNPTCPADNMVLKKEQVFPDAFTERALNGLHLHCTNQGCAWYGTYKALHVEGHSAICEHALINCVHSQCKMKFQRSRLDEHLGSECEYRNVKCHLCGKDITFASIKEHVGTICEDAPVTCSYCKKKVVRKHIERHERHDCDEVPETCEYLNVGCKYDKTVKRKEMREHLTDGLIEHGGQLLYYTLGLASQFHHFIPRLEYTGTLLKIQDEFTEKFVMVVGKLTGLEKRIESIESSGGGNARLINEVQELTSKVRDLTTERAQQAIDSYNGTLVWKIESYQRKRQDAINGVKTTLYSPPFYSAQYGYKMCAKIYMNGDGFGKGSHLSLFFVVMRGEYDALQTWPFQKKITMMLLDQGNGDHMIDAFHSDPESSSFRRPKSDMNIASGSPLFMPLDSLNNRQYIKDDVMFIKIIVD